MLVTENNLAVKMQINNFWNEFLNKVKEFKTSRKMNTIYNVTVMIWYRVLDITILIQ